MIYQRWWLSMISSQRKDYLIASWKFLTSFHYLLPWEGTVTHYLLPREGIVTGPSKSCLSLSLFLLLKFVLFSLVKSLERERERESQVRFGLPCTHWSNSNNPFNPTPSEPGITSHLSWATSCRLHLGFTFPTSHQSNPLPIFDRVPPSPPPHV